MLSLDSLYQLHLSILCLRRIVVVGRLSRHVASTDLPRHGPARERAAFSWAATVCAGGQHLPPAGRERPWRLLQQRHVVA